MLFISNVKFKYILLKTFYISQTFRIRIYFTVTLLINQKLLLTSRIISSKPLYSRLSLMISLSHAFRRHAVMIATAVMLSTLSWSCKSSSASTATTYHRQQQKPSKPRKDTRPLPSAAKLPVQQALVSGARQWLGTPYVWGGENKDGADCSGFVMTLFRDVTGISIPRNSRAQKDYCIDLDKNKLEVGDLVFFSSPKSGGKIAHVGMYIGDNMMVHASSSKGVIESSLDLNYYIKHFQGAGRIPTIAQAIPVDNIPDPARRPDAGLEEIQLAQLPPAQAPVPAPIKETRTEPAKPVAENQNTKPQAIAEPVIIPAPAERNVAVVLVEPKQNSVSIQTPPAASETQAIAMNEDSGNQDKAKAAEKTPEIHQDPGAMVAKAFAGRK